MPVAPPTAVARFVRHKSSRVHTIIVAAGASIVVVNASAAEALAPSADPALKPNQPNHRRPAPSSVNGTLCGRNACRAKSLRGFNVLAATNAAALLTQGIAVGATIIYSGVMTFVLLKAIGAVFCLRADVADEGLGMDVTQHGEEAYADGEGAILILPDKARGGSS